MNIELNQQQVKFLLYEVNAVKGNYSYSQYVQTIAQQLYDKLIKLHEESI